VYLQLIDFISAFVEAGVFFVCSYLIHRKKLIKPYITIFLLLCGLSLLMNVASPVFKEPFTVAFHWSLGFLALTFLVKHVSGSLEKGLTRLDPISFITIYAVVLSIAAFLPETISSSHIATTWYITIATGFLVCFYLTVSWFFLKYWRSRQTLLNIQVIAAKKMEIGVYVTGLFSIPIIMLLDLNAEWFVPEWILHTMFFALIIAVVGPGYLFAARRKSIDPFFSLFSNKEQLYLLRTAIQQSSEGIVITNMSGRIIFVNSSWAKMHGYEKDELIGKNLDIVLNAEQIKGFKVIDESLLSKGSWDGEINHLKKDYSVFPTLSTISLLRDAEGKCVGTLSICRDITERKEMQEKLEKYSQHLEELVDMKTIQLREANEKLLKSERLAAIGELAGMVGHDIRNPLTGIAGATYYMKTYCAQEMDDKAKEMLAIIEEGVERSNKIINDLLEYSRGIKLDLIESNPKSIIKEALSLVEIPKGIRIEDFTENRPKVKVDPEKVRRALANIIKNAVDAMPKGGTLTIKSRKTNGNLEIALTDTGIGIPKEVLDRIWTPLFTTKAKGMGFGLAICKRFIEAHGGKILVSSTPDKGTTFTITIPLEPKIEEKEETWTNLPESS
jgi:PAS domain S-box-containing protein